jgi:hypothetical protein
VALALRDGPRTHDQAEQGMRLALYYPVHIDRPPARVFPEAKVENGRFSDDAAHVFQPVCRRRAALSGSFRDPRSPPLARERWHALSVR